MSHADPQNPEDGTAEVPNRFIPSPRARAWAYGVILVVAPLLVTLGVISGEVAGHVAAISGAVLGIAGQGLALANLPK